jgi:DNA-binding NarL/FixJ family response regulator
MKKVNILLADDHKVFREGLKRLLELDKSFKVVGEAENGQAVIPLSAQLSPSIILMDIAMPILNGIEASRQILRDCPSARILLLSAYRNDIYLEDLLDLGIAGYLPKHSSFPVVARAVRDIANGGTYFDVSTYSASNGAACAYIKHLTTREVEVLQLIAEGEANKQIADDLQISTKTVEKHRQSLKTKLRIHDTAGLTRYAISAGILEHAMNQRCNEPAILNSGI